MFVTAPQAVLRTMFFSGVVACLVACFVAASAQAYDGGSPSRGDPSHIQDTPIPTNVVWTDARSLSIQGRAFPESELLTPYVCWLGGSERKERKEVQLGGGAVPLLAFNLTTAFVRVCVCALCVCPV